MAFIKNYIGQKTTHLKLNKRQQLLLLFYSPIDTCILNVAVKIYKSFVTIIYFYDPKVVQLKQNSNIFS